MNFHPDYCTVTHVCVPPPQGLLQRISVGECTILEPMSSYTTFDSNFTVWQTQVEVAELFQIGNQNISLRAKNLFEDGELDSGPVVKESLTTAADRKRYKTNNLDLILAIGYRVINHAADFLPSAFILHPSEVSLGCYIQAGDTETILPIAA